MTVEIDFEGEKVTARIGESVFAALTAAGHLALRHQRDGTPRGAYCGMGVCQECLVAIDGIPNQRACMTKVAKAMSVGRMREPVALADARVGMAPRRADDLPLLSPELLVIGGGPAGLSAAITAREAGVDVLLVDEREAAGGQYFKPLAVGRASPPADRQHRAGAALVARTVACGAVMRMGTTVWGAFPGPEFAATGADGSFRIRPRATIIATGAVERGWQVPGWTLPGVMTTGAAQALWRTARRLPGKRVLIAGNGPLNLHLAAELVAGGAQVVGLVEAARAPGVRDIGDVLAMALAAPRLVVDGIGYLARLRASGVPVLYASTLTAIAESDTGLVATIGGEHGRAIEADAICLGYGLRPAHELARALGLAFSADDAGYLVPERGVVGDTAMPGVFVVGDGARIGGAHVAMAEGRLAGLAVAGIAAGKAHAELARHRRFQTALWRLYAPARPLHPARLPEAIVCRCESVTFADIAGAQAEGYTSAGAIKQRTRLGMGRCQGRYCAPVLGEMIGDSGGLAPRVPLRPVAIGDLAR